VNKHLRLVLGAHLAQPSLHRVAVGERRLLLLEMEKAAGQTLRDLLRPIPKAAEPIPQPSHVAFPRQPAQLPSSPDTPVDAAEAH
jgi:hypothetical protein